MSSLELVEELSSASESELDSSPKFSLLLPPLLIAVGVSSIINWTGSISRSNVSTKLKELAVEVFILKLMEPDKSGTPLLLKSIDEDKFSSSINISCSINSSLFCSLLFNSSPPIKLILKTDWPVLSDCAEYTVIPDASVKYKKSKSWVI